MIYLDSSALLKLVVEESESAALEQWLTGNPGFPLVASQLVRVELVRAARRLDQGVVAAARGLVAQLDLVPIDMALLDTAADLAEPLLRSLDAIHLAAALSLRVDLHAFVAYDRRLASAAQEAGLPVVAPAA